MANQVDPKMLSIDFLGESKPVTDTVFTSDSLFMQALALNRKVQLTIEKQGIPYLFVTEPECHGELQYAVMVYISGQPAKSFYSADNIEEHYSEKDKMYCYHSEYYPSIIDAGMELEALNKKYKNAYIFQSEGLPFPDSKSPF